jgi:hypothetical protein
VIGLESTSAQARFANRRELIWIADGATIAMPGFERALNPAPGHWRDRIRSAALCWQV